MQKLRELPILRAAFDLSRDRLSAMQGIAKGAAQVFPRGPIIVAAFDDPDAACFERADDAYIARFHDQRSRISAAVCDKLGSVAPGLVADADQAWCQSLRFHGLVQLCIVANTGDGGGIFIVVGDVNLPNASARRHLEGVASHVAAAWRIRSTLSVDDASLATTRDALRRIICDHEQVDDAQRSAGGQNLWSGLLDGSWSLLDTFTADWARTRYVVACQSPPNAQLRALSSQERAVVEHVLAGRSGKWIAYELQVSESNVSRALRSAVAKVGGANIADLHGVRTASFELLHGVNAGATLAVARLSPHAPLPATLSDAERAIVAGIVDGKYVTAIARERGTSPRTVSHQISSIYKKLGTSSRREVFALLR